MERRNIILVFLIHALCGLYIQAENYYFRNLSISDGLPQTTVNTILQDSKGFMWFGTKWGLCRYDGMSIRNFHRERDKPYSIGNNIIKCLYEDAQKHIWVGTDDGLYVYYPEQETFFSISHVIGKDISIEHTVTTIGDDGRGRIWFAVETEGLYCYDQTEGKLICHKPDGFTTNVQSFVADKSGRMWIGLYGGGLYYSDDDMKTIHPYVSPIDGTETFRGDVIMKIVNGPYNRLYISSIHNGIQSLNLTTGNRTSLLSRDESGEAVFGRELMVRSNEELWIGAESGIYIYNLRNGKYKHLNQMDRNDPYALSDNAVYALYEDSEGGIWVGTYFGGVNFLPKSYTHFEKYYPVGSDAELHGKRIREFCRDDAGMIWIGTEDGGLNKFNPDTKVFSFFTPSSGFTNIQSLCMVDGYLWVGTFSKGLKIIEPATGRIVRTFEQDDSSDALIDNSIFAICQTTTGDVFIGTMFGLMKYKSSTATFEHVNELAGKFVYDIREDSNGNIWLATYVNGAYCYKINERAWKNYVNNESDPQSLPSNKVLSVYEDSDRNIWLTTEGGGCCRYEPASDSFTNYNTSNGLPTDVVYQIIDDNKGHLWLTSNSGLIRFDSDSGETNVYTTSDGLLCNQFNYRSALRDLKGDIYLGSLEGFVVFNPETFDEQPVQTPLAIFDFMLFNKEVYPFDKNSPLEKSITYSDSITLSANQNSFSFRIGALDFQQSGIKKLLYRLDGFDADWIELGESPIVTYSNLSHGKYRFRMKMLTNDEDNEASEYLLYVRIKPPFYLTVWAYLVYIIVLLAVVVMIFRYFKRRSERIRSTQLEKFEREKETEIYKAKIDFFTNVAHEIRTPLTLIKGPLESILRRNDIDAETHDDLNIMSRNTDRLLSLTNQLLDFRRVESQGYSLNFCRCDVSEIVRETYTRFRTAARDKCLDFTLEISEERILAHVNREAFIKILSNLFNNGIKYADTYLHIRLELDHDKKEFKLITENDGAVIPLDVREKIFRPFVRLDESATGQVTTGTGIGLALSRSLAELHSGSLRMGVSMECNIFQLSLPMEQNDTILLGDNDRESEAMERSAQSGDNGYETNHKNSDKSRCHTVLVVEDNDEMRDFIRRQLVSQFKVYTAANGKDALEVINANFVNLVISDVIMPEMDGFELCKAIKSDIGSSHIPVVLLTAKTNVQSKITGMELGADSYIEKPFSPEYLLAVVSNLIDNREKLRREFANSHYAEVSTMALSKADEEFIKKLRMIIQANISNQDFNIDDMAESFNMSRSTFYRKVEGVLDLTPKEYLRVERLKKAAELLKEKEYRINEICYMVGFNTSSYFTKCFLKQYGVLPKDFA